MRIALVILLISLLPAVSVPASDDADARLFFTQQSMASKGDAAAQYYLGEMYEHGLGTEPNLPEAFRWYEKSAAQGNRLAKNKISKRKDIEIQDARERAALATQQNNLDRAAKAADEQAAFVAEQARKRAAIRARLQQIKQEHREAFE